MLSFILGLIPGLANTLAAWVTARGNEELAKIGADKDVALGQLASITASNQAKATVIGIPGVKWLLALTYIPVALHSAVIVFGRMHVFGYEGNAMDFLPWERDILMSLVIMVPGMTGASALQKWASK